MPRRTNIDNPYALLGVDPTDDFGVIRAKWRRLVKTFHPDVWYGSEAEATRRLMAINDAFDRISVLHKRVREEAERAKPEPRPKPSETRKARRDAQPRAAAQPNAAPPKRPSRPSRYADRFDKAREAFSAPCEAQVQSFA